MKEQEQNQTKKKSKKKTSKHKKTQTKEQEKTRQNKTPPRQNLVHLHACRIMVSTEPDDYDSIRFVQDSLVHSPSRPKMREKVRHCAVVMV